MRSVQIDQIETRLRDRLATKVRVVEKKAGQGEIHIRYFSVEDLDRILDLMNNE